MQYFLVSNLCTRAKWNEKIENKRVSGYIAGRKNILKFYAIFGHHLPVSRNNKYLLNK